MASNRSSNKKNTDLPTEEENTVRRFEEEEEEQQLLSGNLAIASTSVEASLLSEDSLAQVDLDETAGLDTGTISGGNNFDEQPFVFSFTFTGTPVDGDQFTATVNGIDFTYTAGDGGDALTVAAVAAGLAAKIANAADDPGDAVPNDLTIGMVGNVLTLTYASPFTASVTNTGSVEVATSDLVPSWDAIKTIIGADADDVTAFGESQAKVFDFSGDPVNSINLAIEVGADSGLRTLDDIPIYLYPADTPEGDNNIVFIGRVGDEFGDVAIVVIYEVDTNGEGLITGADLWAVIFDVPFMHPDPVDDNDFVSITAQVQLTTNAEIVFNDFSEAPNGHNDWLAFGNTSGADDIQILVTGLNPDLVNPGNDDGDTVNTSSTGLGSNKQSISPGDGMQIHVVQGMDDLFPLTSTVANTFDTIDYDNHVEGVSAASFQLVQVNGSPTNEISVRINLWDEGGVGNADTDEQAHDLVKDSQEDDLSIDVVRVEILDAAGEVIFSAEGNGDDGNHFISFINGTVEVTGLQEDEQVRVFGEEFFDYFVVENISLAKNDSFDIGNIRLIIDEVVIGDSVIPVNIYDAGLSITANTTVVHDETSGVQTTADPNDQDDTSDTLPAALSGRLMDLSAGTEIGHAHSTSAAVTIAAGADGEANVALTNSTGESLSAVATGLFTLAGNQIYLYSDSNDNLILGREGDDATTANGSGDIVFALYLDTDETLWLVQFEAIAHDSDGSTPAHHDDVASVAANTVYVTVTDGDGDTATASTALTISFDDDGPVDISPDETRIANIAGQSSTQSLDLFGHVGVDLPGDTVFNTSNDGLDLTALFGITTLAGESITTILIDGHTLQGVVVGGGNGGSDRLIFQIDLNPDSGNQASDNYTFTLFEELDDGGTQKFSFLGLRPNNDDWFGLEGNNINTDGDSEDILVTGEDVGGDTVNTSQTGLGTNNNSVNPGELLRFDFVTGLERPGAPEDGPSITVDSVDGTGGTAEVQTITVDEVGGTFTLGFGIDTTGPLAWNISAGDLQTALNGLASVTTAGGVMVTSPESGVYEVTFTAIGDFDEIVADGSGLTDATGNFDDVSTMEFTGHYSTDAASFTVSQTQSGVRVGAVVRIFDLPPADEDDDGTDFSATTGVTAIQKGILEVFVTDDMGDVLAHYIWNEDDGVFDEQPGTDILIYTVVGAGGDNLDVAVNGMLSDQTVSVIGEEEFERMEVSNNDDPLSTNPTKSFDISGFSAGLDFGGAPIDMSFELDVLDGDLDTASGTLEVTIYPDVVGTAGDDELTAGINGSAILAGGGADTLNGSDQIDLLMGEAGADIIFGNDGADTIDGGLDNDTMTGGAGADTFVFDLSVNFGDDEITDYSLSTPDDVLSFTDVLDGDTDGDLDLGDLEAMVTVTNDASSNTTITVDGTTATILLTGIGNFTSIADLDTAGVDFSLTG